MGNWQQLDPADETTWPTAADANRRGLVHVLLDDDGYEERHYQAVRDSPGDYTAWRGAGSRREAPQPRITTYY